jgi:glutamate dehydrogenase/leucine dehydrogenase
MPTVDSKIKYDEFGPEKIIQVYDPKTGLHAYLVIDNTTLGPGKGGIRLTNSVSLKEVCGLARAMTWKNSMAGIPFGGAKSGIKKVNVDKEYMIKFFASKIKEVVPEQYVAGPDISTGENEMKLFADIVGTPKAATGKPLDMGGLPHELGSTGIGVCKAVRVAANFLDEKPTSVAIEGFGNVGTFTAKCLASHGFKIVAVSDSKGTIYNPDGLDVDKLLKVKKETGAVKNYKPGEILSTEKLFELPVDVLIPGALPYVINENNVEKIKSKMVVEAANIPVTYEAEKRLHEKGILIIPDFVANAGGVISSYVEFIGGTKEQMFDMVKKKIGDNTRMVLEKAQNENKMPREAALEIAKERLIKAKH